MAFNSTPPVLGEIVRLVRGTTYKSALLGQPGPVLLGLASIQRNGGFRTDSLKTYGGESKPNILLQPGDLFVSLKDVTQSADLLGAVARVPESVTAGRLTQDTVKLEFGDGDYPRDLVYWALRTPAFRSYCREHATGTTNLGLARDDFLAYRLPQADRCALNLVELLEALERRIDLLRHSNAALEAIARALFKSWFVDFDPVRAKSAGRDPEGMDAATAALFPASIDQWRRMFSEQRVQELVDTKALFVGDGYRAKNSELGRPGVAFLRAGDLLEGRVSPTRDLLSEGAVSAAKGKQARHGDTVFTSKGTIGRFAFVPALLETVVYSPQVCYWRALDHRTIAPEYLHFWMRSPLFSAQVDQVRGNAAIMDFVSLGDQRAMTLHLPEVSLQSRFAELVRPLLEQTAANRAFSDSLVGLRDTLLPRLISGKLRLPDVAQLVEAVVA